MRIAGSKKVLRSKCTVLFAQDPQKPGVVNPNYLSHIPGLEALETADLLDLDAFGTTFVPQRMDADRGLATLFELMLEVFQQPFLFERFEGRERVE